MIRRVLSLMTVGLVALSSVASQKIILDIGGDVKNGCRALACLQALADEGRFEIIAVGAFADDGGAVAATNAFYGRAEIPFGWADNLIGIYRKALSESPDQSVVLCSIGKADNIRRLCESQADALSPQDGLTLVRRKVKLWYAPDHGGIVPDWPTAVCWTTCGGALGPVMAAYYVPKRFFIVEKGSYVHENGGSGPVVWRADENSSNCRLVSAAKREIYRYGEHNIKAIADELAERTPRCRRTDEAITAFRRAKCEKTDSGVRMLMDGNVLWNFELETSEGRPFFSSLMLPSGRPLPDLRPKDSIWQFEHWFSWKSIDGVNYWEPADGMRKGAGPVGQTRVVKKRVITNGFDCVVELELEYGPRGRSPVLREWRTVIIDPPDPKGGYIITTRQRFSALDDIVLGCLPPYGQSSISDISDPCSGEGVTFTRLKSASIENAPLTLKKSEKLELAHKLAVHADKRVKGGALVRRPVERLGRGLVALASSRGTHVSWRILETDAPDAAFDLWRRVDGRVEKVNADPIVQTSDYFIPGYSNTNAAYSVDGKTYVQTHVAKDPDAPYVGIRLKDAKATVTAVAVGDLDGDGEYDYVVKTPDAGTDPWELEWKRAATTAKLEAYSSRGKFLWSRDLGVNIELGVWYSPFLVADLDGDGKAEVALKSAPTDVDYRDPDGRVYKGPEYLSVLDGLTGEERAKTPWIPRGSPDPIEDYNHFNSRNQMALACLDGKTPCIILERGTYGKLVVEAYRLVGASLERVWCFNNEFLPSRFKGQGDHGCLCEDVDGDGCDEVLIGSLTLDHDGTVLWCNGRGHSDAHYYGDIDPERPGMELAFYYETPQPRGGGIFMADPVTGEEIWKLQTPTRHVHAMGICADIAPEYHGLELYAQEAVTTGISKGNTHPQCDNRWFFAADGRLICALTNCTFGYQFGKRVAYWDADLQREVIHDGIRDHEGGLLAGGITARLVVADLFGDWREEVIGHVPGELRIYTTPIPAMDRRVTLMRDRSYRSRITMSTSGYCQPPILQYAPSARDPNVSVRTNPKGTVLTIDVTAPLDRALDGTLEIMSGPKQAEFAFKAEEVHLPPGGCWKRKLALRRSPKSSEGGFFTVRLNRPNARPLVVRQPVIVE